MRPVMTNAWWRACWEPWHRATLHPCPACTPPLAPGRASPLAAHPVPGLPRPSVPDDTWIMRAEDARAAAAEPRDASAPTVCWHKGKCQRAPRECSRSNVRPKMTGRCGQRMPSGDHASCRDEQVYNEAAGHFAAMLFLQRMRTPEDRAFVIRNFADVWGIPLPDLNEQAVTITAEHFSMGRASLTRSSGGDHTFLRILYILRGLPFPHESRSKFAF